MEKTLLHSLMSRAQTLMLVSRELASQSAALVNHVESMVTQDTDGVHCEIAGPHVWEEGTLNYRCRICGQLRFKDDGSTGQDAGVAGGQAGAQDW